MKTKYLDFINEGNKNYGGYEFNEDYYDFHHGQHDVRVDMYKGGEHLAYVEYTLYDDKVYIKYIESIVKGHGYGTILMEYLADKYGYGNLERSSLTPDGKKMRDRLDKKFNYDYDKELEKKNKHISQEIFNYISNDIVKGFLKDSTIIGYEKSWEKWLKNSEFRELSKNNVYDFDDITNISEWIKGSVMNNNRPDEEPPKYILKELSKIMKK